PGTDTWMKWRVIKSFEIACLSAFVLLEVFLDAIHQRFCIREVEHDLTGTRALQGFVIQLFYRRQIMTRWQSIEMIKKIDGCLLVLNRKLMRVIALMHTDAVLVAEFGVQLRYLAYGFVHSFNREKIQY